MTMRSNFDSAQMKLTVPNKWNHTELKVAMFFTSFYYPEAGSLKAKHSIAIEKTSRFTTKTSIFSRLELNFSLSMNHAQQWR